VAGESNYTDAIRRLLGDRVGPDWTELKALGHLVPEPTNKHDANAVQVFIGGRLGGYLPREDAARYAPVLSNLVAQGYLPQVSAEVRGAIVDDYEYDARGRERTIKRFVGSVRLDLAEPHLLIPANAPPDVPHVLLPRGNAIQVTGEEVYVSRLAPMIGPAGETWIHVTLHEVHEQMARSTKTLVEVRVDGAPGGRLTPKMSSELLPAIRHFAERGLTTAGRAILKGNQLKADITLYVARAGELPQEWLAGPESSVAVAVIPGGTVNAAPPSAAAPATAIAGAPAWRFNAPPGWPPPPAGWTPPPGWAPPPDLPPAPRDWQWWLPA
jgi:collagen type III alpha